MLNISGSANNHQTFSDSLRPVPANNDAQLGGDGDLMAIGLRLSALVSVYRKLANQAGLPGDKSSTVQGEISKKIDELIN